MRVQLGSKDSKPDTTWSGLDWRLAVWFGALNFENMTISSPLLHVTSQAISACFCPVAMHLQWPICPEAVNDCNKKKESKRVSWCVLYTHKKLWLGILFIRRLVLELTMRLSYCNQLVPLTSNQNQ